MASRADAKKAVLNIAEELGFVPEEVLNRIDPEARRTIEKSLLAKDKLAAHSIKTLAKNIYGSDARFVFEVLQNADDNRFERATACGDLPSIAFHVHPGRIIVECNEDGFTERDLSAICAVGQSTKSASYGYIGAKGIGFKSVFIAAWKVHIQSGHFSFYFKHRRDDPGLGMVTPIWVEADTELPDPMTRITLDLHDTGDPEELEHLRSVIFKQLADLQPTCLLFLRNLRRIQVIFYDDNGCVTTAKDFSQAGDAVGYLVTLGSASTMPGGSTETETKHFHITRHMASKLSKSQSRELSKADEASGAFSTAEIVLAFPLTEDFVPAVGRQGIFAFLPVEESAFKFLIQSDFDTTASRQGIMTTSKRNIDLLDGIAEAFFKAVLQFCEHEKLCYTWPQFLPRTEDKPSEFWLALHKKLEDRIHWDPIFRARGLDGLHHIEDIIAPGPGALDKDGGLLLDPCYHRYLSGAYPAGSISSLVEYGLSLADLNELVEDLEWHLKSDDSKMKASSTSEEWHSAVAKLFSRGLKENHDGLAASMKRIPLLPLAGDTWASAEDGVVYLPTTAGGIRIPPGLELQVLESSAVNNPDRRELFTLLGVVEASDAVVRSAVLKLYSTPDGEFVDSTVSRAHLHFLYLNHSGQNQRSELHKLYLWQADGTIAYPHRQDIYLPGNHPYGPEALLGPEGDAPGYRVALLHPHYLEDVPSLPASQGPSWAEWLVGHLDVREFLRIVSRDTDSFTDLWKYVVQHQPRELLGLLKQSWQDEGTRISKRRYLRTSLLKLDAGKLCGYGDASLFQFFHTWLPFPNLQRLRGRFMTKSEPFPFLELKETGSVEELTSRWGFLGGVAVKIESDNEICFLMTALKWMFRKGGDERFEHRVLDLFATIETKLRGLDSATRQNWIESIRETFDEEKYLPLSNQNSGEPVGAHSDDCIWEGPPGMTTRHSLKAAYTQLCDGDAGKLDLVSSFVKRTLELRDVSWGVITEELRELRDKECNDLDRIRTLYHYLSNMHLVDSTKDTEEIRNTFGSSNLIFVSGGSGSGWYTTSQCLWSSTAEIQGKSILNRSYADLEDFFLEMLGVKTLTVEMVYDDLKQTPADAPVDRVKKSIECFSSLLRDGSIDLDPEPLLQATFLPVRYPNGAFSLASAARVEFAIVDRQCLGDMFRGRIKLLDYELEDVRRLAPFFHWAGLERFYLSRCTREITSASLDSARPISARSRKLGPKAHSILRIAAHFNSPRYLADKDGLYRLLRSAQVLETEKISTVLSVSQDGRHAEVEKATGDLHIEETSAGLRVFVPRDRKQQKVCFHSVLPFHLAAWLMRHGTTQIQERVEKDAVLVLGYVLVLPADRSLIDPTLSNQGIIRVELPEGAESDGDHHESESEAESEEAPDTPLRTAARVGGVARTEASIRVEYDEEGDRMSRSGEDRNFDVSSSASSRHLLTPDEPSTASDGGDSQTIVSVVRTSSRLIRSNPSVPRPARRSAEPQFLAPESLGRQHQSDEDRQYTRILDAVLRAARAASFPSKGPFAMGALQAALHAAGDTAAFDGFDGFDGPGQIGRGFRSTTKLERDKKIGAAGELYVFELLSRLDPALSGWSLRNWQSTVRKYVTVHPEYAHMEPWYGSETADITYEDSEGGLTALLVDNGYLDGETWHNARPRYFIEVKSTTGPCAVPFYMSKSQYQRMKAVHERGGRREVYMILRVFDIGGSGTGMQVYLDPEQLRMDRELAFTAETWSIVPGPDA